MPLSTESHVISPVGYCSRMLYWLSTMTTKGVNLIVSIQQKEPLTNCWNFCSFCDWSRRWSRPTGLVPWSRSFYLSDHPWSVSGIDWHCHFYPTFLLQSWHVTLFCQADCIGLWSSSLMRQFHWNINYYEVESGVCFSYSVLCDHNIQHSCRVEDTEIFHCSCWEKMGLRTKWLQQSQRREARGRQVRV